MANHIEIPIALGENHTETDKLKTSNAVSKVQETSTTGATTAKTYQNTAGEEIEITVTKTIVSESDEAGALWQENRNKPDQPNKHTQIDKSNMSVENSRDKISYGVNRGADLKAGDKSISEKETKLDKTVKTDENTAKDKGNILVKTSQHESSHDVKTVADSEVDDKHINEEGKKLDKADQSDQTLRIVKNNKSIEGRYEIPHVVNRDANEEAGDKTVSEKENKLDKIAKNDKNSKKDKGNTLVEASQLVSSHGVNRVAELDVDDKHISEERKKLKNKKNNQNDKNKKIDKSNLSDDDSRYKIPHGVNRVANLEAGNMSISEKWKKIDKIFKNDKNTKMDTENILDEDSQHKSPHGVNRMADVEVDDKRISGKGEKRDKTDQNDRYKKIDKSIMSVENSRYEIPHGVNRVANFEASGNYISEEEKKFDKTFENGKHTKTDEGNILVEDGQHESPHGINRVAYFKVDDENVSEKGKKLDKTDNKHKHTQIDKSYISDKESRYEIPQGVNRVANLEVDNKDMGIKEGKRLDKKDQKGKSTKTDRVILAEASRQATSRNVNRKVNSEANSKDLSGKGIELDKSNQAGKSSKGEKEVVKYKAADSVQDRKAQYSKTNNKSDGNRRPKETEYYGKDVESDYIKTKYVIHKSLKENGPKQSAKQRALLVKERCQTFLKENNIKLNPDATYRYGSFMTSRRYNLSICYNCKVASTNIKRLIYALDNKITYINSIRQTTARAYGKSRAETFQQVMSGKRHINVMLVREPLERLLSAYRDERAFKEEFGDPSFSFKMYLQLILDKNIKNMNRHVYPYFERCRPCEMQYDFIGLQRHFNDDIKSVLKEIGAGGKVDIPKRKKTGYNFVSSDKLVKQYFKKIPNDIIHKLWEKYYKDYYIFGFPYPTHLMT